MRLCICLRLLRTFVYGFCVRIRILCTFVHGFCSRCAAVLYVYRFASAHVVQLWGTYTAFVRIENLLNMYMAHILRILCVFYVRIGLIFTIFNADSLEGYNLEGSLVYFVRVNDRDSWIVSRDPILRVLSISFVCKICSWLLDSLEDQILRVPSIYFVCASCSWLLDTLDYPILIVLSISLSARSAHDSPSKFLGGFFVSLDRSILPGGLILLCTMLLCGSYINSGYERYFGCNYDILG